MKKPSRMRQKDQPTNMDSSAYEVYSISSDSIENPYSKRLSNNGLVSSRYGRTVKFTIPDKDKLKLTDINENNLTSSGLPSYRSDDKENAEAERAYDFTRRRMSAPELPPIAPTGKISTLVNNGFVLPKSNTFHRYSLKASKKSIHSDSSVQGYGLNTQSRTSSSSSQKSRARVLSAGASRQIITADLPKNLQQSAVKEEIPAMRNGATTVMSQRCVSVNGIGRQKSKYNLKESVSTPRLLPHSRSEAQLSSRMRHDSNGSMRRNDSDKSLTERINAKNNQNNKSSQQKLKNGIRRYASTNGLNVKDEKRVDDDESVDSDSDSEKDQRVINWIIGVTEIAEPPEEPTIEHVDEPPQRDTAIRIVYDGDS